MSAIRLTWILLASALLLAADLSAALAATPAGRFLFARGQVSVTGADGVQRTAHRGASVFSGDTISTAQCRAQIRFTDDGFISLVPNTRFGIDEYQFTDGEQESGHIVFSLLKGGCAHSPGSSVRKSARIIRCARRSPLSASVEPISAPS